MGLFDNALIVEDMEKKIQSDDKEQLKSAFLNLLEDQQASINKLTESERFNRLLFEQSPIGLAINRLDGVYIDVNTSFANLLGRTISEIIGLSIDDITPEKISPNRQRAVCIAKRERIIRAL